MSRFDVVSRFAARHSTLNRAALLRSARIAGLAAGTAAIVVVLAVVSGTVDSSNTTLVLMGFDWDRAQLITALLVAGAAAAAAALTANRNAWATLAGLGSFAALFGYTFLHQTHAALVGTASGGAFDLTGWVLTFETLLLAGVISSWAGATLALAVRPALIQAGSALRETVAARRLDLGQMRLPLAVAVVAILLVVSVPVFGDMVNYTTDARMLHGQPQAAGLVPGAAHAVNPAALPSERPWLSWLPTGKGSVAMANFPSPWKGNFPTEDIGVYTPPGYDPSGQRRYPVLYEAPFAYGMWDSSINISVALDALIDAGTIPPIIVVFVDDIHAPFADTECANSIDSVQQMDTFLSQTVVSYVDSHYLTIPQASGRAFTGFSEGGYCAAILALRHPDVFGTSIPFSGYYWAGEGNSTSTIPFGNDPLLLDDASPMVVATRLAPPDRAKLYFVVIADPTQPLYGPEADAFEHLLSVEGYHYVALQADMPHGWEQVRQLLPSALEAWAAHLVNAGVI